MITEEKSRIEHFIEQANDYIKTREELAKLKALDRVSSMVSSSLSGMIVFAFFVFVILFASIAFAFVASSLLGSSSAGFAAVALFYLVLGILLAVNREKWLKKPLANSIIKNYFKHSIHDTH